MNLIDATVINAILTTIGKRQTEPAQLFLLGGCAMILLGSSRVTEDVDYAGNDLVRSNFQLTIAQVAEEFQVSAEAVPIEQFVPLPVDFLTRHVYMGRFGVVDVYAFDPYTIALSKLDRGQHMDLDDVVFLVKHNRVALPLLSDMVAMVLTKAQAYQIDSDAMRHHLAIVRERLLSR